MELTGGVDPEALMIRVTIQARNFDLGPVASDAFEPTGARRSQRPVARIPRNCTCELRNETSVSRPVTPPQVTS
jgi:hypothetical protein